MNYNLLKEMVKNSDLTKSHIAQQLGVSRNTLDTILNGSPSTRVQHVEQICQLLNVNINVFFDGGSGKVTAIGTGAKAAGRDITWNSNNGNNTKLLLRIKELEGKLETADALAEERKATLDAVLPIVQSMGIKK